MSFVWSVGFDRGGVVMFWILSSSIPLDHLWFWWKQGGSFLAASYVVTAKWGTSVRVKGESNLWLCDCTNICLLLQCLHKEMYEEKGTHSDTEREWAGLNGIHSWSVFFVEHSIAFEPWVFAPLFNLSFAKWRLTFGKVSWGHRLSIATFICIDGVARWRWSQK